MFLVYVALLGYYANRTRILARANETAAAKITEAAPPSTVSERLTFLQKEQERLKADIAAIRELKMTLSGLTNDVAVAEKKNLEVWFARSNELESAIKRERTALQETVQWSRDWERRKVREAAEKRLAEKGALNLDPVKEQERTGNVLSAIALATKERMKLQESWRVSSDKSKEARENFMAELQKINTGWLNATRELGADTPLYEQLPLMPAEHDHADAVIFRSIIPDAQGRTVTVLLDGTVKWSGSSSTH